MHFDVAIIGGGAAGLFCAIEAGKRRLRTLVIEHNAQAGKKILISGGGRCNFTNLGTAPENFISANQHFAKSALARYTPDQFVRLVRKHRIEFYEKKLGQLFCRDSSRQVVDMLLAECQVARVDVRTSCTLISLKLSDRFELETSTGPISADRVVVASGGLSYPKIGASGIGYRIAEQFGIRRTETRPSLVALVRAGKADHSKLAGISIDAAVTAGKHSFRENILFTHRGLSGPAILQISNYWKAKEPVSIDLLPSADFHYILETNRGRSQKLSNFLAEHLPHRFVSAFAAGMLPDKQLNRLSDSEVILITEALRNWQVMFTSTEGYDRAEVTLGGVSTSEISSQTMESKKVPGLYFIGEVVDVTGWLGGYNFQWAWSSAYAAAAGF